MGWSDSWYFKQYLALDRRCYVICEEVTELQPLLHAPADLCSASRSSTLCIFITSITSKVNNIIMMLESSFCCQAIEPSHPIKVLKHVENVTGVCICVVVGRWNPNIDGHHRNLEYIDPTQHQQYYKPNSKCFLPHAQYFLHLCLHLSQYSRASRHVAAELLHNTP